MKNRNVPAFNGVSKKTMAIGATMCFFTGLAGYLSFGDDTKSNILENFHGPMGAVFKVALVVHLLLYIPGDFVIMRDSLLKLRSIDVNKMSDGAFLSFSLLCLSVITLVALLLQVFLSSTDSLAIVVDITGGIAGSMLYFIIPALCALGMFKSSAEIRIKSYVLLLFGCAIVIAVILSVILA
jgi:sodium-coupled neutral amino acid transporter 11